MTHRLPIRCEIQPGESLPGLLSRAAITNVYASLGALAPWFGLENSSKAFGRTAFHHLATGQVDMRQIARLTENSIESIESAAVNLGQPCPGAKHDAYYVANHWRFCPACLEEGTPHQRLWLIPFVTACPKHQCRLIDRCHHCEKPHTVNRWISLDCNACQHPSETVDANPTEVACAENIQALMDTPTMLKELLDRLMFAWHLSTSESLRRHCRFSPQLRTVDEMRNLLTTIWPAAQSEATLSSAIGTQLNELSRRWPRFSCARSVLVERAINSGGVAPPPHDAPKKIPLLRNDDPWWVPMEIAAGLVDLSTYVMKPIVDQTIVRSKLFSVSDENGGGNKFRLVDLDHWHAIVDELLAGSIPSGDTIGTVSILSLPLHEVIRDFRKGALSIFHAQKMSLCDLHVKYKDTSSSMRRSRKPDDTMTVLEVSELIGGYHAVVADLVKKGILKTHRRSSIRRLLITRLSVEKFHRDYVLVGALAKARGINPTNLAEKLQSLGIEPAPMNAPATIYYRSDIEGVLWEALSAIKGYKTGTGRKSTVDVEKVDNPRVKKLIALVNRHGGASEFIRKFGGSQGTLSLQLREQKSFGPLAARRVEEKCGLPEGYF